MLSVSLNSSLFINSSRVLLGYENYQQLAFTFFVLLLSGTKRFDSEKAGDRERQEMQSNMRRQ